MLAEEMGQACLAGPDDDGEDARAVRRAMARMKVSALDPAALIDELAKTIAADSGFRARDLMENDRPVGLLNRQSFVDRHARPCFKELHGCKPCMPFANTTPWILDKHTGLDAMTAR